MSSSSNYWLNWRFEFHLDIVMVDAAFPQPPLWIPTWASTARTLQLTCCRTHRAAIVSAKWTTMGWISVWSWTQRVVPLSPSPLSPQRFMRRRHGAVTSVRSVCLCFSLHPASCLSFLNCDSPFVHPALCLSVCILTHLATLWSMFKRLVWQTNTICSVSFCLITNWLAHDTYGD